MKFSVLMSVYGKDNLEYFQTALESVTSNQTVSPAQVVIVQDGPLPDVFDAVIENVSKQTPEVEFTVIKKENNAGLAAALNSGIGVCRYEWIARMDSDDISLPDRFEKQLVFIAKNRSIDVLGGTIAEFRNSPGDIQSERHVGLTESEIKQMAKRRTPMNHMTVMYRKDAVIRAGGYAENFGKLEDYKLWVDMLSTGAHFANVDDILVYARIGNGLIERRSSKREVKDWDMLQECLLKTGLIGKTDAFKNRLYIRAFIYMPAWLKKIAYKTVLRK